MPVSRSLLTFAFVAESFGRTGDIVQGLMPLFSPIVQRYAGKPFDPLQFSRAVEEYYGIYMHPLVAEDWAPRLASAGLLESRGRPGFTQYTCLDAGVPVPETYLKDAERILTDLYRYIADGMSSVGESLQIGEIELAVHRRLSTMEFLEHLRLPGRSLPNTPTGPTPTSEPQSESNFQSTREAHLDFLCAQYVLKLRDSQPDAFNRLTEIAGGALVSEIVLGLRVPPQQSAASPNTRVFLDTPLLIDILDLGNKKEALYAKLLLKHLGNVFPSVCAYTHGLKELQGILHAVLLAYDSSGHAGGPIGDRIRTERLHLERVRLAQRSLEAMLRQNGIKIVDFERQMKGMMKYVTEPQMLDILAHIRPYGEIEAREADAVSVAHTLRLVRASLPVGNILSSPAIFVTKNRQLARVAMDLSVQWSLVGEDQAPPFITDRYLAGLLFLAIGGEGMEVPTLKLIANCAAAVAPRPEVIDRMMQALAALSPEKIATFEALMKDERCAHYLMELSLGDEQLITEENGLDIYEKVRAVTAEETIRRKDIERDEALRVQKEEYEGARKQSDEEYGERLQEMTRGRDAVLSELAQTTRALESVQSERDEEVRARRRVEEKVAEIERGVQQQRGRELDRCRRFGVNISTGAMALAYVATSCAVYAATRELSQGNELLSLIVGMVPIAVGVLGFWVIPEKLFGRWRISMANGAYRWRAERMGLGGWAKELEIDSTGERLVPLPMAVGSDGDSGRSA